MTTDKQTPEQIRDIAIKAAKKALVAEVAAAKAKQQKAIAEAWSAFLEAEKAA